MLYGITYLLARFPASKLFILTFQVHVVNHKIQSGAFNVYFVFFFSI